MNFSKIGKAIKDHYPLILSSASVLGVISTAYLAGRASYQAAEEIEKLRSEHDYPNDKRSQQKAQVKRVWKLYIPTAISATSTIACIVGANRVEAKKTLAAQTAFAVSQRAYSEYRDRVIEEFGERKDQAIRDKVAEDRVRDNEPPSKEVMFTGPGVVLCCELFTGRYFTSDMETLRRAQNSINENVLHDDYASLTDFYHLVGLPTTKQSGNIGWTSDKLLEISYSAVLTPDSRPCIAFDYNYVKSF